VAARFRRSSSYAINVAAVLCCALLMVWLAPLNRAQAAPFAAVVMDARSGQILHATNHDTRLHPASLTKMMTLYVAFEAIQNGEISLDTRVRVSRRAAREVPSRLGLREGQTIALRYLIRAAALRSGNDAATAIAEAVGGSVEGFAARMNRTAAAIGMSNTRFHNAHGLTASGHLSTARDMTILGRQLYFDFPQYYNIFSRRSEDAGIAHVRNTNSRFLDNYAGADGIKTGFTNAAGYNLTAMAERNGVRIIVTVFGGRSVAHRHEQVVQLMNRGFREAPARVAIRRPAPPNYSSAPQVASNGGEGRSAGRVIRLQTAPERSVFPARRPLSPSEQPSEQLLASLQNDISAVLAEVVNTDPESPAAPATDETLIADASTTSAAPARSPVPPARPEDEEPVLAAAEGVADDLIVARAVGFSTIDPQEYLELTEGTSDAELADAPITTTALTDNLSETVQEGAAEAPEEAVAALASDAASEASPVSEAAIVNAIAESLLSAGGMPVLPPTEELLADVVVENGLVIIPGLPPIAVETSALIHADSPAQPIFAEAATIQQASATPQANPQAAPLDGRIVLTSSDSEPLTEIAATPPPMPEIVTRVSTSGGRVWAVDLGLYPSRFDAERTLLRVALSENGTLGSGVRRVGQRSGRFVAGIHSLTQEQAELACLRLSARAQSCDVIHP
jgi:D-alanyl-D-alanine carboxypeptidase